MKRGEVWMVDFGVEGHPELTWVRLAAVLKVDLEKPESNVTVVPITPNLRLHRPPTTLRLKPGEAAGYPKDLVVLCNRLKVRDKACLLNKLGELAPERLTDLDAIIVRLRTFAAS